MWTITRINLKWRFLNIEHLRKTCNVHVSKNNHWTYEEKNWKLCLWTSHRVYLLRYMGWPVGYDHSRRPLFLIMKSYSAAFACKFIKKFIWSIDTNKYVVFLRVLTLSKKSWFAKTNALDGSRNALNNPSQYEEGKTASTQWLLTSPWKTYRKDSELPMNK